MLSLQTFPTVTTNQNSHSFAAWCALAFMRSNYHNAKKPGCALAVMQSNYLTLWRGVLLRLRDRTTQTFVSVYRVCSRRKVFSFLRSNYPIVGGVLLQKFSFAIELPHSWRCALASFLQSNYPICGGVLSQNVFLRSNYPNIVGHPALVLFRFL